MCSHTQILSLLRSHYCRRRFYIYDAVTKRMIIQQESTKTQFQFGMHILPFLPRSVGKREGNSSYDNRPRGNLICLHRTCPTCVFSMTCTGSGAGGRAIGPSFEPIEVRGHCQGSQHSATMLEVAPNLCPVSPGLATHLGSPLGGQERMDKSIHE